MRWNPLRIPAAVVAALVLVVTLAGPAPAAVVAGPAAITGVGSGQCLDVNGGARTAKTGVAIRDCTGAANQAWTLTTNGELQVYDAATCLDVAGHDTTAPAAVQIYPCNGGSNQKWRLQTNGTIVGVQSGLCLDVTGRGTANGTVVGMWTCNGQTNQSWTTSLRTARHHRADGAGQPARQQPDLQHRDVRLERLDGRGRRRVLRRLPRRPAHDLGQRQHAARPACPSSPARSGAST